MAKDELAEAYSSIYVEKNKTVLEEADTNKKMTVGKQKSGDELEGPTKQLDGTGPDSADFDKAVEAPKSISPAGKTSKTSKKSTTKVNEESTDMSRKTFEELYNTVMVSEEDLESAEYNDEMGDFPPSGDEGMEGEMGEERDAPSILGEIKDLLSELISVMGGGEEMDVDVDMDMDPAEEGGFGEATSEPEPRPLTTTVSQLQLPSRKLGGPGTTVVKKKASGAAATKKHNGELEAAPAGFKHDKSKMKVDGSGAAVQGNNQSAFE